MKKIIILLISLLLDGLIPNITLYNINNLTYFTPMCTVICLIFLYNDKDFIKLYLQVSIIYGSLYMSNILLSFILFFCVMISIKLMKKILEDNLFIIILEILIVMTIFDGIYFLILSILTSNFIFNNYLYKFTHSLLLNLVYGLILYKITKKSSKFNY